MPRACRLIMKGSSPTCDGLAYIVDKSFAIHILYNIGQQQRHDYYQQQ